MRVAIVMASLGYDMESGKVVGWLKAVQSGTLVEIVADAGTEVEVGAVIGYIDEGV